MSCTVNELWAACLNGDADTVNSLLDNQRVDPSAKNSYAIQWAARGRNLEVVNRLLEDHRVDPSANGNAAIRWAAESGHISIVHRLLEDDRVDPSAANNDAMKRAALSGHYSVMIRLLKDHRVDPSAHDNLAIRWTAANGHLPVVNHLLEGDRVDPSAHDNHAIRWAVDASHAIQQAASRGLIEIVKLLVQDPRVHQAGPFDDLPCMAREMALELHKSNSMPFDFASMVLHQDLDDDYVEEVRETLQVAHNRALGQVLTLLCSGAFSEGLQQDAQCRIVWISFGHVLFPLFPKEQRHCRIALLVECINRLRPLP